MRAEGGFKTGNKNSAKTKTELSSREYTGAESLRQGSAACARASTSFTGALAVFDSGALPELSAKSSAFSYESVLALTKAVEESKVSSPKNTNRKKIEKNNRIEKKNSTAKQ